MPYTSYIMENVLFKISYPAEFHAQTAVEAAHIIHAKLKDMGKTSDDIKRIRIRTQEAAMRIINKKGPLDNFADREWVPYFSKEPSLITDHASSSHDINYMVAFPLIHGKLTSESYTDAAAADARIDALRAKIQCVEEPQYSIDYHDPAKRSISNALSVELNDGTVLDEVEVEYPVGHKRRRAEGTPLLLAKFERHIGAHFDEAHQKKYASCLHARVHLTNLLVRLGSLTRLMTRRLWPSCPSISSPTSLSRLERVG